MATKSKGPDRVDSRPGVTEMQAGLRKIARRKAELIALDPNTIQREEDERPFDGWPPMWNDTVAEIFGRDSVQFNEYQIFSLNQPDSVMFDFGGGGYDARRARESFSRGKAQSLQVIE